MAALATPADLASYLQTSVDTATATQALDKASGAIRSHCLWTISQETVTAQTFDGTGTRSLWLPTLRLTNVASVTEKSLPLTVVVHYDWTLYGRLIRVGCWPDTPRSIVVTYTHGWSPVPDAVAGVCLNVAARRYEKLKGLSQLTVGDVSETSLPETLTGPELRELSPYVLRDL